ncbi:MAG: DUF2868 domain-containing protein [Phycisphaerae bacterium]|nr:DUF2868 domain-containing protein [Phycisphaerae bacterium]
MATLGWLTAAVLVLFLFTGAVAARAALAGDNEASINVVRLIVALLGVQSLVLLAWLTFMIVRPRSVPLASVGGAMLAVLRSRFMLGRSRQPIAQAALTIKWNDMTSRLSPRWRFGAVSNAAWSMFNVGCVATLLLLLSTQEHRFHWETTILSARHYASMTTIAGALPSMLGFAVPTPEQVASTEGAGASRAALDAARTAWAGLVVGALVSYALLPRLLLTLACLAPQLRRQAGGAARLAYPAMPALRARLTPPPSRHIVDPDAELDQSSLTTAIATATTTITLPHPQFDARHTGSPAIVAIEPPHLWTPWPPAIASIAWRDLGVIDDRHGRDDALRRLRTLSPHPRCLVIACSLLNTPDRGELALLASLRETAEGRTVVLLSDGQALRDRSPGDPGAVEARIDLWRSVLASAGFIGGDVIEIDLQHVTAHSSAMLAARIGPSESPSARAVASRLDDAFILIASHARDRACAATPEARARLLQSIAALYRSESTLLARWLGTHMPLGATNLHEQLRHAAVRVSSVLPARLGLDPRWLAAGAVAGALGCIAVATVVTPAALGMLPVWSGVGAAVSAGLRATTAATPRTTKHTPDASSDELERGETVRAAALFALVLELQGRDESAITRILDRTFIAATDRELSDPAAVATWLAGVRHRAHQAIAQEGGA